MGSSSAHYAHLGSPQRQHHRNCYELERSGFHSPLLNRIWQLLPGFILWQTWKERNRRIFKNTSLPWHQCWRQCHRNIMETLHLRKWSDADTACPPSELPILQYWMPLPSPQTPPSPLPPRPRAGLPIGLLPQRTSSNSILTEPLKEIPELQGMEWSSVITMGKFLS
jgi:hypothetical protein